MCKELHARLSYLIAGCEDNNITKKGMKYTKYRPLAGILHT